MAKVVKVTKSVHFGNVVTTTPIDTLSIEEVIDRIERLNTQLAAFWSKSDGWAPAHVAGLLGKSRLDWQVSLSTIVDQILEGQRDAGHAGGFSGG